MPLHQNTRQYCQRPDLNNLSVFWLVGTTKVNVQTIAFQEKKTEKTFLIAFDKFPNFLHEEKIGDVIECVWPPWSVFHTR